MPFRLGYIFLNFYVPWFQKLIYFLVITNLPYFIAIFTIQIGRFARKSLPSTPNPYLDIEWQERFPHILNDFRLYSNILTESVVLRFKHLTYLTLHFFSSIHRLKQMYF